MIKSYYTTIMQCIAHTPSCPSTAEEAWYCMFCALSGWLISRPKGYLSLERYDLLILSCTYQARLSNCGYSDDTLFICSKSTYICLTRTHFSISVVGNLAKRVLLLTQQSIHSLKRAIQGLLTDPEQMKLCCHSPEHSTPLLCLFIQLHHQWE